jgi:phage shock protein A
MSESADFPALGFDPAPGKPNSVDLLAENLRKVATEVGDAHSEISGIGNNSGIWTGQAAEAFQQRIGPLPEYLEKANESLGNAGKVLGRWASDLSSMQRKANHYEAEAEKAEQRLREAESHPDLLLTGGGFPQTLLEADERVQAATQAVTSAHGELEAIRQQAKRLREQHEELVDDVIRALEEAKDDAVPGPGIMGLLEGLLELLGEAISALAAKAWEFIKRHAEDIKAIGDVLALASGILTAIAIATALIPPIGAIFAGAAGVTNAGALAAHSLAKAAGAEVSWGMIAFEAVGLIPFGKGFALGDDVTRIVLKGDGQLAKRMASGADDAVREIREGQWLGTRGLSKIGVHIDPMSRMGRALDGGITGGTSVGNYVYQRLFASDPAHASGPMHTSHMT